MILQSEGAQWWVWGYVSPVPVACDEACKVQRGKPVGA